MTLTELLKETGKVHIYTPNHLYQECLLWLHEQNVCWNSCDHLDNPHYYLNQKAPYDNQTVLTVNGRLSRKLTYGCLGLDDEDDEKIIDFRDIIEGSAVSFDDLDKLL